MIRRSSRFYSIVACSLLLVGHLQEIKSFSSSLTRQKGVHGFNRHFLSPRNLLASRGDQKLSSLRAKRRRRKEETSSSPSNNIGDRNDDLPDFDLDDGDDDAEKKTSSARKRSSISSNSVGDVEISANMLSSSNKPARSIPELLADRSLERRFQFDQPVSDVNLPDLAPIRQSDNLDDSSSFTPTSKKIERKEEARRLAKLAAEKEQQEKERLAILDILPGIKDEKGKVSPIKILETGTWACIIALISWEVYINTPFFDRAAPMTPVVY